MTFEHPAAQGLRALLTQPEGAWTLGEGALAIARIGRPDLHPGPSLQQLEDLGLAAREQVARADHPRFAAAGLSRVLFERGYRSVGDHAACPEHALLDQVLAHKAGTATALCVIAMEAGRRAGVRLEGIGLPGHFILRCSRRDESILFDPAQEGRPLSVADCRRLVERATGGRMKFREGYLRPITQEQILARLICYLKQSYWQREKLAQAATAVQLLLTIRPDDPREIRDLGRLSHLLGRHDDAIEYFEAYLTFNPCGEDVESVRRMLAESRAMGS